MSETKKKSAAPFSLRLTQDERRQLERQAAGLPIGTYVRARLLGDNGGEERRRTRGKFPVRDHEALARVLAWLGQSRLSSNINQLARAANSGSLPVDAETRQALNDACQAIGAMKRMLMTALGIRER